MLSMFTPLSGSQVHQVRCFPCSHPCLVLRSTRYDAFHVHILVWFSGSPCNMLSKFMPLSAFSSLFSCKGLCQAKKNISLNLLSFAVSFFHWLNVCIHVHMYIIKWVFCCICGCMHVTSQLYIFSFPLFTLSVWVFLVSAIMHTRPWTHHPLLYDRYVSFCTLVMFVRLKTWHVCNIPLIVKNKLTLRRNLWNTRRFVTPLDALVTHWWSTTRSRPIEARRKRHVRFTNSAPM